MKRLINRHSLLKQGGRTSYLFTPHLHLRLPIFHIKPLIIALNTKYVYVLSSRDVNFLISHFFGLASMVVVASCSCMHKHHAISRARRTKVLRALMHFLCSVQCARHIAHCCVFCPVCKAQRTLQKKCTKEHDKGSKHAKQKRRICRLNQRPINEANRFFTGNESEITLNIFIPKCLPPSSRGLGHFLFTEKTGIRIPLGV